MRSVLIYGVCIATVLLFGHGSAYPITCFAFDPVFVQSDEREPVPAPPPARTTLFTFTTHSERLADVSDEPASKISFHILDQALSGASK